MLSHISRVIIVFGIIDRTKNFVNLINLMLQAFKNATEKEIYDAIVKWAPTDSTLKEYVKALIRLVLVYVAVIIFAHLFFPQKLLSVHQVQLLCPMLLLSFFLLTFDAQAYLASFILVTILIIC